MRSTREIMVNGEILKALIIQKGKDNITRSSEKIGLASSTISDAIIYGRISQKTKNKLDKAGIKDTYLLKDGEVPVINPPKHKQVDVIYIDREKFEDIIKTIGVSSLSELSSNLGFHTKYITNVINKGYITKAIADLLEFRYSLRKEDYEYVIPEENIEEPKQVETDVCDSEISGRLEHIENEIDRLNNIILEMQSHIYEKLDVLEKLWR